MVYDLRFRKFKCHLETAENQKTYLKIRKTILNKEYKEINCYKSQRKRGRNQTSSIHTHKNSKEMSL